jgi:murein DD-endopeptidase MepM/ murein hydrolase activator NlpD
VIEAKRTLSSALSSLNISGVVIQEIVDAAKPIANLERIRPGIRFQITKNEASELTAIEFRYSAIERLRIFKTDLGWQAQQIKEQVDIKVATFSGIVNMNLWESAMQAEMDPNLISELAEIFAWEVDFAREVRVNDRWRLAVEQKFVKGKPIGWGSILAAEYENAGQSHQAVLFRHEGQDVGYFSPEGASLRKMFLKSPIRYGRITSRFSMTRFHPVLKVNRPHLGVDYGAPIGTPVRAVGDGTVVFAKYNGGGGNTIRIRHNSVYETIYKHLNGYAKGIRSGVKVRQGQVIGYVGNTGLSTGPHLHFEFYHAGRYVDPLKKNFPSADPVPQELMATFKTQANELLTALPRWDAVSIANRASEQNSTN